MAFFDDAALADVLVIHPMRQGLGKSQRELELLTRCILAKRERQSTSEYVVAAG